MATLDEYLGDGQARVTVGAELAHSKDYGCKAQSFVSISVACNSADKDIIEVHDVLFEITRKLVNADLEEMKADRDTHIGAPTVRGHVSQPPTKAVAAPKVVASTEAAEPAAPRPSFRR